MLLATDFPNLLMDHRSPKDSITEDSSYSVPFIDPNIVYCVAEEDVICGRDKYAHRHPGNKKFRIVIQQYCERYRDAKRRADKTEITNEVISHVTNGGGRFVKFEKKCDSWVLVAFPAIQDKVSHALRSCKVTAQPLASDGNSSLPTEQEEEDQVFQRLSITQQEIYHNLLEIHCPNAPSPAAGMDSHAAERP